MPCANSLRPVLIEDWRHGGFGLYTHWPFCEAKCPYCDFNSHVSRQIDQTRWRDAYLKEIDRVGALTRGRVLDTVFFGGGTPSLMDPETVHAILERVRRTWPMRNDPEITLEANPSSVEARRFRGYAEAGVNRVSLGVQALNDDDLRLLGRLHSVAEARQAFDIARDHFDRVSFDLIYARQNQSLAQWEAELREALSMAVDHLSMYQLTIEQGTAFGDRYNAGKLRGLPEDDVSADMYERTQEICEAAGLPAYEVSNHARPGAESRHNLIYWRYGDYVGIGPGAHGRLTLNGQKIATEAWKSPDAWLKNVDQATPDRVHRSVSSQDAVGELIMMGLRVNDGIDIERIRQFGPHAGFDAAVQELTDLGMLQIADGRIQTTPSGRMVLNAVVERLLPDQ